MSDLSKLSDETLLSIKNGTVDYSKLSDDELMALKGAPAPEPMTLAGFGENVKKDITAQAKGIGQMGVQAFQELNPAEHPVTSNFPMIGAMKMAAKAGAALPGYVKERATEMGGPELMKGEFAEAGKKFVRGAYEKPVTTAMDVATVAAPMAEGLNLLKGAEVTGEAGSMAAKAARAGEAVGEVVSKPVGAVGDLLDWAGNKFAGQSIGLKAGRLRKVGLEKIQDIAKFAKENVVTPGASTEKMMQTADLINEAAGQRIGNLMGELDKAGQTINVDALKNSIQELQKNEVGMATNLGKNFTSQYQAALDDLENLKVAPTYENLFDLKKKVGRIAFKGGVPQESKAALQDVYGVITDELDRNVNDLASKTGKTDLLSQYQKDREIYEYTTKIGDTLEQKAKRQFTEPFSISPIKMISREIAHQGPQIATSIARPLSSSLESIAKNTPQAFGKFAGQMTQAAQRGGQALAATNFLLQQNDPEYRKLIEDLDKQNK